MNSDYADPTEDFTDISAKFTAGKRYCLQCTSDGVYRVLPPDTEKIACILFRAPTAQRMNDIFDRGLYTLVPHPPEIATQAGRIWWI